jgi:hypothetical protein
VTKLDKALERIGIKAQLTELPFSVSPPAPPLLPPAQTYLYLSSETFFTLGLGDVAQASRLGRGLVVIEAGVGFAFLALVIGYLPVLYQSFSRRRVSIPLLDARAGSPPSAEELPRGSWSDPGKS